MQYLQAADALLMPSYFEGQPITLFEAMARGVVPGASLLPGITDTVVSSGSDGFLVRVGDEAGFADALARLTDPAAYAGMSPNAWEKAREHFSVGAMTRSYLKLISLCRERRKERLAPGRSGDIDLSLLGKRSGIPAVFHEAKRAVVHTLTVKRTEHGS
jgi:glycosyltransferase involved in cell wall biosynthesis